MKKNVQAPKNKPALETTPNTNSKSEAKVEPKIKTKVDAKPGENLETKPEAKAVPPSAVKVESIPDTKPTDEVEPKPDVQTETKAGSAPENKLAQPTPDTKTMTTPQIAARAYKLYKRLSHRDSQPAQSRDKTEQEIRVAQTEAELKILYEQLGSEVVRAIQKKDEPKIKTKVDAKPAENLETKPEAKAVPPSAVKVESIPDTKPTDEVEPKPVVQTETKAGSAPEETAQPTPNTKPTDIVEPKPDVQTETKPKPDEQPAVEVSEEVVKKVHILYEQLGREVVRAIQKAEDVMQKTPEAENKE